LPPTFSPRSLLSARLASFCSCSARKANRTYLSSPVSQVRQADLPHARSVRSTPSLRPGLKGASGGRFCSRVGRLGRVPRSDRVFDLRFFVKKPQTAQLSYVEHSQLTHS
jgi:hypothetical protein